MTNGSSIPDILEMFKEAGAFDILFPPSHFWKWKV